MVNLTAEMLELKANPNRTAHGAVIEAKLDKGEKISSETVADMAKAVGHMMKSEAKTIWMMKHHEHGEEL